MVDSKVCCQQFTAVGLNRPSLKVIMTAYYDGPTAGLFKCDLCGRVYRFFMVDWDGKQEVRIHALAPMPVDSFRRLEELQAEHGPKWWPEGLELEDVLAEAGNPNIVGAFSRNAETMFAARELTENDLKDIQEWFSPNHVENTRDWFSFLGIPRRE
jgi:hypothetical protein